MKYFKNRSVGNEEQVESQESASFENSNSEKKNDEGHENNHSRFPSSDDSLFKRYSFDDNGGGYQGL